MKQEEDGALRRRKEDKERPLLQNSGQIEKKNRQDREEGPEIDQMATDHHYI